MRFIFIQCVLCFSIGNLFCRKSANISFIEIELTCICPSVILSRIKYVLYIDVLCPGMVNLIQGVACCTPLRIFLVHMVSCITKSQSHVFSISVVGISMVFCFFRLFHTEKKNCFFDAKIFNF